MNGWPAPPPRPWGNSRQPKASTPTPSTVSATPSGVKVNMPNGSPSICSRRRETMMLGLVPISVQMPPSSEAKASGISSRDGVVPWRRANWNATGRNTASAPIFFITADSSATAADSTTTCRVVVLRRGDTWRNSRSTTPERSMAALTTRAAATRITMSSANP